MRSLIAALQEPSMNLQRSWPCRWAHSTYSLSSRLNSDVLIELTSARKLNGYAQKVSREAYLTFRTGDRNPSATMWADVRALYLHGLLCRLISKLSVELPLDSPRRKYEGKLFLNCNLLFVAPNNLKVRTDWLHELFNQVHCKRSSQRSAR